MFSRIQITTPLVVSLVFLVVLTGIVAAGAIGVVKSAIASGAGENQTLAQLSDFIKEHDEKLADFEAQFNGRSIYDEPFPTPPPRPPAPPRVIEEKDPEPVKVPSPPKPPASYSGPALLFAIGEQAWFEGRGDSPQRISVGETVGEVTVMEVNPPRYVKVGWRLGEYEVPFFEEWGSDVGMKDAGASRFRTPPRRVPGLIPVKEEKTTASTISTTTAKVEDVSADAVSGAGSGVANAATTTESDDADTGDPESSTQPML